MPAPGYVSSQRTWPGANLPGLHAEEFEDLSLPRGRRREDLDKHVWSAGIFILVIQSILL